MFHLFVIFVFFALPRGICPRALPQNVSATPDGAPISTERVSPAPYHQMTPLLDTPWTLHATENPWPQHPRPLLYRDRWQTLNGLWTYQKAFRGEDVHSPPMSLLARTALIPSCIESVISGLKEDSTTEVKYMWFARNFSLPIGWEARQAGQRILLHFEAVDYEATVFLNGNKIGFNRGGYFRFSIDITDDVSLDGSNELYVNQTHSKFDIASWLTHLFVAWFLSLTQLMRTATTSRMGNRL